MRTLSLLAASLGVLLLLPLAGCSFTLVTPYEVTRPATGLPLDTTKPVRLSGGVVAGALLHRTYPVFPEEARRQRVNGTVVLHAIIGKDGHVKDVTPLSGPALLIPSYAEAVRQWTYRPFQVNGEPVEVDTTITLNIQINGS